MQMRRAKAPRSSWVPGTRQETRDRRRARPPSWFYAGHNWQPFFLQADKTFAYELSEGLGLKEPDISSSRPAQGATSFARMLGFSKLFRGGEIAKSAPAFRCAARRVAHPSSQAPGRCMPRILCQLRSVRQSPDGASIAKPVRAREVLAAVRRFRRRDRHEFRKLRSKKLYSN